MDLMRLADEIVGGRRLSRADDLSFFEGCDLDALNSGASAMITGDMLTTTGSTISGDMEMISSIGRRVSRTAGGNCDCDSCC